MAKKKEVRRMYVHSEDDYVHIVPPGDCGAAHTLCGYCDCMNYEDTEDFVTCPACIRAIKWAKSVVLPS